MTMEKNILKSIKRELDEIKKEAKSEDLEVEDIIFDEYDEALINEPTKRNFKAKALKKGMAAAMLGLTLATGFSGVPNTNSNIVTVEAAKKKDKKKPVIKFDVSSKIEVGVNESVKIPKTTAKDNKDGNVTKKIAVKVTKGKKQFKDLAKKIKSNKAVTFTSTGSYVITYTVSDKAGNKATKKRYVTVKEAQKEQTTRRPAPARVVPTPATTEVPTTTETPTTEAPTTEAPTTEDATTVYNADLSKYAEIEKLTINGNTYNIAKSLKQNISDIKTIPNDIINRCNLFFSNINMGYNIDDICIGFAPDSIYKNIEKLALYYIGQPSFYYEKIDLSNNIIIYPTEYNYMRIFVVMPDDTLRWVSDIYSYTKEYSDLVEYFYNQLDEPNTTIQKDDDKKVIITPSTKQDNLTIQENVKSLSLTKKVQ